ncbi:phospho-N-acetylmuramoyl-pentapeptide-transferase [Phosphitispora sp. TUW77]|uniref:phospho-N-acetylmuramoyl-pentapeptide- transferase n=1 Tax=Phosphitispora sp. TUW77 TaxID=3152361 RepID=UPI003AB296AD
MLEEIIYGFGLALIISFLTGLLLIPMLYRMKFGQYIRDDGPKRHFQKAGTPTMGGVLFLAGAVVGTLVFAPKTGQVFLVLVTTLAYGMIGFVDDYIKVVLRRSLGLRAREKLAGQLGVAIIVSLAAVFFLGRGTELVIPFSGYRFDINPVWYILFTSLIVIPGTVNAVNFTDGLDGLAAGSVSISMLAFILAAIMTGLHGVAVFGASLVGGCLGFLRYNTHPARVFMGDTGSMALGGALASMAVITRMELFIPLIGFLYVAEILSVMIQVLSFKTTGKRVFLMSPLHHHFELKGWREQKVVRVFWLAALISAAIGLLGMHNIG